MLLFTFSTPVGHDSWYLSVNSPELGLGLGLALGLGVRVRLRVWVRVRVKRKINSSELTDKAP